MRRGDFIKISLGASAAVVASSFGSTRTEEADALDTWARSHRAEATTGADGIRMLARPDRNRLSAALHELNELADGPIRCSGRIVTGQFRNRPFRVELRVA